MIETRHFCTYSAFPARFGCKIGDKLGYLTAFAFRAGCLCLVMLRYTQDHGEFLAACLASIFISWHMFSLLLSFFYFNEMSILVKMDYRALD
jgi:hypothetical protein